MIPTAQSHAGDASKNMSLVKHKLEMFTHCMCVYIYVVPPPKTYLFYTCIGIYSILCRLLAGVNKAEQN